MLGNNSDAKILIVGDAGVDIIVHYPKFLNEERTLVEYSTPFLQGGGTAANTAVALSRLGVKTEFLGTIGNDNYGKYIIEDFKKENVDIRQLIVDDNLNTVGVFAFIDDSGERYLWGWPREKQAFNEIDIDKVDFEKIKNVSWVHSSGMPIVRNKSSRKTIIEIFKYAYELGITTSFDLNLRVDNGILEEEYKNAVLEVVKYSNYVLGSADQEFYYLNPKNDYIESASSFVNDDRTIIMRLGEIGSVAITKDAIFRSPGFIVDVEDTLGAGDVYNAGFIASMVNNKSIDECLSIGNAVSAYKIKHAGSRSTPTIDQLREFIKYTKVREINEKDYIRL